MQSHPSIARPYPSLTPSQVEIGKALVRSPEWRWRVPMAAQERGGLVEVREGVAPRGSGELPYLSDPKVAGALLQELREACGVKVDWSLSSTEGGVVCTLKAGSYEKSWVAPCLGEAVGAALAARWAAMARRGGRR